MRTIAIMNNKGGVGKTVTAINLADILVHVYHKRVVLVDCDGQANLSRALLPGQETTNCLCAADVLCGCGESLWSDNLVPVVPGLDILVGSADLYDLDLNALTDGPSNPHAFRGFADAAREEGETDYMIFDCPPGFTVASVAALMAADEVVVPMALDGFSFDGVMALRDQIRNLRTANYHVRIAGVLVTKWTNAQALVTADQLLRQIGDLPVFEARIRATPKVVESTLMQESLRSYSPRSGPARDYLAWVQEYLGEEAQDNA